jgi:hypothetical protein
VHFPLPLSSKDASNKAFFKTSLFFSNTLNIHRSAPLFFPSVFTSQSTTKTRVTSATIGERDTTTTNNNAKKKKALTTVGVGVGGVALLFPSDGVVLHNDIRWCFESIGGRPAPSFLRPLI